MELKENRECNNSVFVDLFYEDETAEENDVSFGIGGKLLVFAEHQSVDTIRKYQEAEEEGKKLGISEGKHLGILAGEERYSKLLIKLAEEGKTDEILKVAQDSGFREKLYKEYSL